MAFGVVEQVPQHAPELVWVADHLAGGHGMRVDGDETSGTQAFGFAECDVVEIDGFVPLEGSARVEPGDLEEVVDEALHRNHLVEGVASGGGPDRSGRL